MGSRAFNEGCGPQHFKRIRLGASMSRGSCFDRILEQTDIVKTLTALGDDVLACKTSWEFSPHIRRKHESCYLFLDCGSPPSFALGKQKGLLEDSV